MSTWRDFSFLYDLFQGHPFALPPDDKGRVRVSVVIYDFSMVAANELWASHEAIAADVKGTRAGERGSG